MGDHELKGRSSYFLCDHLRKISNFFFTKPRFDSSKKVFPTYPITILRNLLISTLCSWDRYLKLISQQERRCCLLGKSASLQLKSCRLLRLVPELGNGLLYPWERLYTQTFQE